MGYSIAEGSGQTAGNVGSSEQAEKALQAREDARDTAMWNLVGGGASAPDRVASGLPESYWSTIAGDASAATGEAWRAAQGVFDRGRVIISGDGVDPDADAIASQLEAQYKADAIREKHPELTPDEAKGIAERILTKQGGESSTEPAYTLPEVTVTAPRMTPEEAVAYDATHGSIKEMGWWDGVFTFNTAGRIASGAGNTIANTVTSVPTLIRQFAYTAGDVGGYVASVAPWVPKHQPMSALFQTLQSDGPAPIVRNVAHGLVSPLKNFYDGAMYGRYEKLGEGGLELAGAALGLRGSRSVVANKTLGEAALEAAATKPANSTRLGVTRTNAADWRSLRNHWDDLGYGDILSDVNRAAIAKGRTPVVDNAWVRVFPEDAGLAGERIPMHHIQGSPITIPLPETRHLDAHLPGGFRYNPGGPGSAAPFYLAK